MAKCPKCGADLENNKCTFCDYVYVPAPVVNEVKTSKNKLVALLLCFFLGTFGGHYFYVGRYVMGVVYFATMGFFGLGVLLDLVLILTGKFKDADGNVLN